MSADPRDDYREAPMSHGAPPHAPSDEEWIAAIRHELSTPLAVIGAAATLALDTATEAASDAEQRELLEVIRRNNDHATRLLQRLALMEHLDDGSGLDLVREPVRLGELIHDTVDDLRRILPADHQIEVSTDDESTVEVDTAAVREIVFNLLSNAVKYSPEGAAIDVRVRLCEGDAEVVIRNHGSGVTPGDSQRIFEKYTQGDEGSPGVGLGLFVSRGLARAHGGDLYVRPAVDRGSEFHLALPRA